MRSRPTATTTHSGSAESQEGFPVHSASNSRCRLCVRQRGCRCQTTGVITLTARIAAEICTTARSVQKTGRAKSGRIGERRHPEGAGQVDDLGLTRDPAAYLLVPDRADPVPDNTDGRRYRRTRHSGPELAVDERDIEPLAVRRGERAVRQQRDASGCYKRSSADHVISPRPVTHATPGHDPGAP